MDLIAYRLYDMPEFRIEPASGTRGWMDDTTGRFAYRCLPLVMANQFGWVIPCPAAFEATWNGDERPGHGLAFSWDEEPGHLVHYVQDHFGHGIVTISLPFVFRTSPGYGLLVRGPSNQWLANAHALDGFVETDWIESTFTLNWKVIEANRPVRFEQDFPLALLQPYPRDLLESVRPSEQPIAADPALAEGLQKWSSSRESFNTNPERRPEDWQKEYFQGKKVDGERVQGHKTRLHLAPFKPVESAKLDG